jgi:hypothetical protein
MFHKLLISFNAINYLILGLNIHSIYWNYLFMREFPDTYDITQHINYCFNDLLYYKEFINRYERFIKDENEDYDSFINNPGAFHLGQKFDYQRNHSANLSTEFPNTLRRSAFISLWSFFENSLNKLCEVYEYRLNLGINFKDMNENGIDRAKLYLKKVVKLDFPSSPKSNWVEIKKLRDIRNCIVHKYSELNNDDKLVHIVRSFPHLTLYPLTSRSIIRLEELFLESVLNIFQGFYAELLVSIKKKDLKTEGNITN